MKILNITILIFIVLYYNSTVFAFSGENAKIETNNATGFILENQKKSIKELNSEVKGLNENILENNKKITGLKLKIGDFFRDDLTGKQKEELNELMYIYNANKINLDKQLQKESEQLNETDIIKGNVLDNKIDIYKSLVPYIKIEKYDEYLEFIKQDVTTLKENTDIVDNSIKKSIILKEKIENIKEKIQEHQDKVSQKLETIILEKINEKINNIKNNNKFLSLDKASKEKVINILITKAEEQIEKLKGVENMTSLLEKKIQIYQIIKEKLEKLIEEL